jgi:hypothetical protein
MLKVEFHSHTNYLHYNETTYSPKKLIDHAIKLGYDALCITEHYSPIAVPEMYRKNPLKTYYDYKGYAEEKGLLLIPAVEFYFNEGEVLLINIKEKDLMNILQFDDLKNLPKTVLKVAPHPYYRMSCCLMEDLERNIDLFDGIEYSYYYTNFFNNANKKAKAVANGFGKSLIGTSDLHDLRWMGYTYTIVDAEKNIDSIVKAVKEGRVNLVTRPLPYKLYSYVTYFHSLKNPWKLLFKIKREFTLRTLKSS